MRHGPFVRATALVMSWVLAATTAWAGAPAVVTPAVNVPLPALYPQLPAVARPEPAAFGTVPEAFAPAVAAFMPEPAAFAPEPMTEPAPPPAPATNVGIFGPQRYVRTTGPKNVYTTTVAVPAWVASPFTMHIQNGEPNGTYRVSSAWIEVNGTQVAAAPANFNQNVPALDPSVALTPQSALKVTLASKPTSYLSISLLGTSADHTAPQVTIEAAVAQEVIKDTRPRLAVKYRDVVGSGEPAASGVDTTSLKVTLDGVDRTSLFTRRSDEATADIPDALALAEGPHVLAATIKDLAGNPGQASADFRVDLTKPTIEVVEPAEGTYLPTLRPTIRVRYADDVGIDLARLSIAIDGSERTHDFLVGPAEATATLDLAAGPRQVTAAIKDKAGNAMDTSRGFRLDVEPPTLTIDQPLAGSRQGLPDVEVLIHYRDDQGLDLATFKASVDGTPIVLATGPEGASGTVHLGDAPQHILAAEIKDKAGNLRNVSSGFSVDTASPFVRVVQPPPGQIIATATPHVFIEYSDAQGVDTTTFKLWVGPSGARDDRTSWCVALEAGADCTIPLADRLPEGDNVITGEIKDSTGNAGAADSRFKVDTVKPAGSLVAPANPTNVAKPTITFTYDDGAGTGIDTDSVHVFIDGADRTDRFLPGATGVTGALPEALTKGEHRVRLEMADLAGNATVVLGAFTVDTLPPAGSFTKPADDTFINDATPELALAYGDGLGTGVVASQVEVFLQRGSDEWVDVTSYCQRGANTAIGVVPDAAPLADGTYHLRAEIQDAAGNAATIHTSFQLDTVPPTYTIQTPANGAHLPTRTPSFLVTYGDNASGVDKAKVALLVDGGDVTAQLPAATATELGGTLAQPLAEGDHVVAVKVLDRAGNQAVIAPHAFTVDTVPPVVVIELPHDGDFLGDGQQLIRITYTDPNGDAPEGTIDPASVKVTVDGTDRTADFTPGDSRAEATLTLGHGPHTVNAELVDWAANPGAASTTFFVDTQPPVVHIQSPIEASFVPQAPVSVTGTLTDDDPTTTVECQGAADPVAAIVNAGTFTCTVPLAERGNVVRAAAKDRFGRTGSDSRNVTLDTIVPVIAILQPPTGVATAGASIEVLGQVHDESAVTVVVGTTPADVQGDSFQATVPLGAGPVEHIVATATDAAGHTSEAFVDVTIDRLAPVVHITSPLPEAYLKGPTIDVHGTVRDASSVSVEVNQQSAAVSGPSTDATFSAVVPVVDGRIRIEATAHDAAANTGGDGVWINVDSVPPAIVIREPAPGFVTRGASVHVAGTATDASSFTLKIEGQAVPVVSGTFAADVPLPAEGSRDINAYAIDAAGNEATVGVPIVVDRTPPALDVVSPLEGAVLGALPVSVVGTVSDATSITVTVDTQAATRTEQAWQAAVGGLPEGGHTFTVIATDAAGNATTVHRAVTIDLSPPVVHIITPADGTVTRDGTVTVSGEVEDRSAVTVVVSAGASGQPAAVTGTSPFHFTGTVSLADGDNTITATATDQTAQPGSAFVRVTRDSVAPTIELVAPEKISRGRPGQATAVVTDNLALGITFTVKVDGSSLGSFTSSPAVVPLGVPAGKVAGDSFQVSVEATDAAGNPASAQREVTVISDGVIVGQVLVDTTSLPLPGATVHMTTTSGVETTTTDERGRYSFPTGDVAAVLSVEKAGMTGAERELTIESGTGTVPVDARLTLLAEAKTILPDGGSLAAGTLTLTVGAGAGRAYRFTPLSAQGLPGLLPMGWSPLAAFHLSAPADGGPLSASATGLPTLATYLVEYRPAIHEWSLVASTGTPTDGALTFAVPGPGSFAVVAADGDSVPIPAAAGDVLTGVPFQMLPPTATSTSVVTPATLPPSGGIARGALHVISPAALPSGTVLQAQVTETFTLSSGEVASEEQRRQDIVLFAHPRPAEATLAAEIPITPSRTFATTELASGKVHLDILAGREGVRGKTGGLEAAQVDSGDVRLGLARQSLAADTAVAVEQTVLSPFLPSSASLVPLGEAVVDFAGQRLAFAAELSLADPGVVAPGDTLLVARVERVDGIPRLVVVALAELSGGRVRTIATPPLPGLREEGRYVFYRSAVPIGFVSGMVTPVAGRALVEMTGAGATPFVALTSADGHYVLAVAAGPVTVRARLLKTALAGEASVTVEAGQTAALDIALVGSVTTATVSPATGALVAPNSQLTLTTETALDPSKVTAGSIHLKKTGSSVGVDLRFVLSGSGKTLTIVPTPPENAPENAVALEFSTDYTFEASGLKTVLGGDVLVPTVSFRTRDDTPPVYNSNALTFSFPDADGNVTVSAPAGTFPPGTQILIVNGTSGFVATFMAENDGAVGVVLPATMPATINDRFIVTVTDPLGNATTFNRSQFVDAAGRTAIGPGGGVVEGEGGVELRIPDGALDKGVTLKIKGVTAAELDQQFPNQKPDLAGANLGSGLRIESEDKPAFKKEVDLAFPVPAAALQAVQAADKKTEDAFFYVYRRIELPNGKAAFEAIDHAFVECPHGKTTCPAEEQRIVTASYPFSGYLTSLGGMQANGALFGTSFNYAFLMWTFDSAFAGKPLAGAITGTVRRTTWDPGAATPQYVPIAGATVSGVDAAGEPLLLASTNATIAVTRQDGGYTLWDRQYSGGPITINATLPGQAIQSPCPQPETSPTRCASGFEANVADWSTSGLRFYQNIASVNVTFPALQPPPPPAEIQVRVMRLVNDKRTDTGGLVVANTPLIIGLTARNGDVRGGSINGEPYGVRVDPLKGADPLGMDFVLDPAFTPTQPGSYTVSATALPAFGSPVTSSFTFRVVAEGGGVDTLPTEPPKVITAKVVPKANAQGVPVGVFPQVAFTEPVRNMPGNVRLADSAGNEVAVKLSGVSPSGTVVDDVTSADDRVTSLTIQPLVGLRYSTTYRLTLSDGIQDLDKDAQGDPAPKSLAAFETSFTTFGPVALTEPGTGETFTSPGIVVLGERAYLVQNNFVNGTLRAFDVSDPVSPREIESARALVTWRPVDIAGEEETTISQGRLVTVATSSTNQSKPSNVYVFDTTSDLATRWIGAVSLTNSAIEGFINRIATKDGFLYAATAKKGIQVVDLAQAVAVFEPPGSTDYWRMVQAFNTDGQGFGQQAVVQSIPVNDASGRALMMRDLKVGDFVVDGQSQPLVVASGDAPLVVVNPQVGQILARPALETAAGSKLTWGQAVAIGAINDTRIAVVVGAGTTAAGANTVLAVVNLNDPRSPQVMSILAITGITGSPTDVLLKGTLALVGTTKEVALVSLQDLSQPTMAGVLQNVAGRLALTSSNLLLSSVRSVFGGNDPLGGVRAAALESFAYITRVTPDPILVDQGGIFVDRPKIEYRAIPPLTTSNATIEIAKNEAEFNRLLASLEAGEGSSDWFENQVVDPRARYSATPNVRDDTNRSLPAVTKNLAVTRLPLQAETRDRQVEVRFAIPASSTKRYALRVFLASATNPFPQTPNLTLPWSAIEGAYENEDRVFDNLIPTSVKAQEPYVIRTIQRVTGNGVPELKEQRAFALEAIFGGYHRYRISLVEEGTDPRELNRVEGQASFEPQWAAMIDDLGSATQRLASGRIGDRRTRFASLNLLYQITPDVAWFGYSGLLARATLPIKRLVGIAKDEVGRELARSMEFQLARGVVNGFVDGLTGDVDLVLHPVESTKAIWQAVKALKDVSLTAEDINKLVSDALPRLQAELGQMTAFEAYDSVVRLKAQTAYYFGYVAGMIAWQIASTLAIAGATAGIGAIAVKAGVAARAGALVANVSARISRALKVLIKCADYIIELARRGEAVSDLAAVWKAARELADGPMVALGQRYSNAMRAADPALQQMARGVAVGKKAIEILSRVAGMPDEAAHRLLNYMIARNESNPVVVWLGLYKNRTITLGGIESNRAIKEMVEAAPDLPNGVSEEIAERLVFAADTINRADGEGANNLVATFVQKHRNPGRPGPPDSPIPTEVFMRALTEAPDGTRFTKETVAQVIKVHSELGLGAWTDDALKGAARLVHETGDQGAVILERLARTISGTVSARQLEIALEQLRAFTSADRVRDFGRLVTEGNADHVALMMSNGNLHAFGDSPQTITARLEIIVDAVNRLRSTADGPLIPGVATIPDGPQASALLANLATGNRGYAFEAVGLHKLIAQNELAVGEVVEMGRRFDLAGSGKLEDIVEADAYVERLGRRISIDFKHGDGGLICCVTETATGVELSGQVSRIFEALTSGPPDAPARFFDEAWFAVSEGVSQETLNGIGKVNDLIKATVPGRFTGDPIRVVKALGGL